MLASLAHVMLAETLSSSLIKHLTCYVSCAAHICLQEAEKPQMKQLLMVVFASRAYMPACLP